MEVSQLPSDQIRQILEALHEKKDRLIECIESYVVHITSLGNDWTESEKHANLNLEDCKRHLATCLSFLAAKMEEISGHGKQVTELDKTVDVNTQETKDNMEHSIEKDDIISGRIDSLQEELSRTDNNAQAQIAYLNEHFEGLSSRWDYFLKEYKENRRNDRLKIRELGEIVQRMKDKVRSDDLYKPGDYFSTTKNTLKDLSNEFAGREPQFRQTEHEVEETIKRTQMETLQYSQIKTDDEFMRRQHKVGKENKNKDIDENMELEDWVNWSIEEEVDVDDIQNTFMVQDEGSQSLKPGQIDSLKETTQSLTSTDNHFASELNNLKSDLLKMTARTDSIETRQSAGFSAFAPREGPTNVSQTCFSNVTINLGNHYTSSTGIFTSPFDGVYMVNLTHRQEGENDVLLNLIHETSTPDSDGQSQHVIGETWTSWHNTNCSFVSVLRMMTGDKLFVRANGNNVQITSPSGFSCYLISQFN